MPMARNKKNATKSTGKSGAARRGSQSGNAYVDEGVDRGEGRPTQAGRGRGCREQMRRPASIYGGCERRGLARGTRWKRFVERPRNWISRRGLFCQGFATRVNMSSGRGIAWSMVIGQTIACPAELLARSAALARSLARPSAEIGNLLARDRHSRR